MEWERELLPYHQAADELRTKFNNLALQFERVEKSTPIFSVEARVKSIPSILAKAHRKQINLDKIMDELDDIAGIRIICRFVDDIHILTKLISQRDDMVVVKEKDFVTTRKPSGYRSYHFVVEYGLHTAFGKQTVRCEIQIRTLAMNFWAVTEHSLRYKYKGVIPENISSRLVKAAEAAHVLDSEINTIREDILDAEKTAKCREDMVRDIIHSIQELYQVSETDAAQEMYNKFLNIWNVNNEEDLNHFYSDIQSIAQVHKIR
ncbi:MAG: GTP pyrophosphokinase family protein [Defluviitaleaceae bacterium]|nr:GTP pyrophosphokinase family protein [Defluviitaleaceae bacterium]